MSHPALRIANDTPAALVDDSPMILARAYLRSVGRPRAHYRGDMFEHDGTVWRRLIEEQARACVYEWAERQHVMRGRGDGAKPEPYRPNSRRISEIRDAMAAITQTVVDQMPAWLDGHRPRPQDVIAFPNGLIDLDSYVRDGSTLLMPPTHQWFSENVLPYPFNPQARCPLWLGFLQDVFSGDAELIALLQEIFGYVLTDDTSQQKAALLIGPPRSGKGTTIRQLVRTIGDSNCASLRLMSLADRFGLQSLIGKTVAVCPDAHLGRSSDSVSVLERLKSIIGEDPQSIDMKFREPLPNVRIRARFILAVNNFPDLPDASAAMRSRLLVLPLGNSYEGAEDRTLDTRLAAETPGVMVWALAGLMRLRTQGRFTEPAASRDLLQQFSRLSSPVLAFVEDRCQLSDDLYVECDAAWEHWQHYCRDTGTSAGTKQAFGLNLKSAVPKIDRKRKYRPDGSTRFWAYSGIALQATPFMEGTL
jgi:putative DNA primase/helicase